jgi:kinesin family member 11
MDHTSNLLSATKEDLKQAQYNLKEKDYIISEQKKAGNILSHCPFQETFISLFLTVI